MIKQFLMNVMLSFIWVGLTGSFLFVNFFFGFILSYFILMLMSRDNTSASKQYFDRIPRIISFIFYFIYELIKANLQVAYDVVTPKFFMKPAIVRFPLTATSEFEINLLANIISLTPGTLILDVSNDKKVLYIHVMYMTDKDSFIKYLQNGFEKKLLAILR
ncbi:cation:proton antiporter [Pedobacter antarcticus 4BY]|uniref:Cation:proton antiporter n=2 Tax=Pedobacter antarcticus TaxID=34086 RepID=A0A081PJZ5_9SPHI|nr:Na+/H+ antiporter subunit E [Pedobacter antarcticus]KEQ31018.1 cation:proton antiporter [Pedobacter antarcticus 4BY]SFF20813.1 multisubunit sodium/proton antiporter, MrpE subunit (TC 2.A.63.1) [Pedobacter antarcticus]